MKKSPKIAAPVTHSFQYLEQEMHQLANETRCEILSFVFPLVQVCFEWGRDVITEAH